MAKVQTRRSVSLRAEEFVRAQHLAAAMGLSVSAAIEAAVGIVADAHSVPKVDRGDALRTLGITEKIAADLINEIAGAHFTF